MWFATSAGMAPGDGSMRAVAIAPERDVVALPGSADPALVAALGLSGVAAWMSLTWRGELAAGEQVLVLGAGGVVGQAAVQLARTAGARRVVAAARSAPAGTAPGASTQTRWSRSTTPTTSRPWPPGSGTRATGRWTSSSTRCTASRAPPRCASCASTAGSSTSAAPPVSVAPFTSSMLRGQSLRVLGYTNNELTPDQRRDALLRVVDEASSGPAPRRARGGPPERGHRCVVPAVVRASGRTYRSDARGGRVTALPTLPTSLVGSYPQPEWLIDRAKLAGRFPPRVRARELWRVADPELLAQAQDDATEVAIRAQERAGLDLVTDGEIRRESYSNHFATALDGIDIDNPGTALDRSGHPNPVPRIVGPISRPHPVQVRDLEFLKAHTDRPVKMTVPGPFTMSQQAQNDHYPDAESAAMAYAAVVNEEIRDLLAAGADLVQIDEPYMQARPEPARAYGLAALNRAVEGITGESPCTSASATPRSSTTAPRATRSCRSWRTARSATSPSRRHSPGSTSGSSRTSPRRRSS